MRLRDTAALSALLAFAVGCRDDANKAGTPAKAPEAHDHVHGPHDGEILELGENKEAHLEMIHDDVGGNLTVYVFGKDLKTPVAIEAPTIVVQTKDGKKEFKLVPLAGAPGGKSDAWKGSNPALATEPLNGRIRVNIGGKDFQPPLEMPGHNH